MGDIKKGSYHEVEVSGGKSSLQEQLEELWDDENIQVLKSDNEWEKWRKWQDAVESLAGRVRRILERYTGAATVNLRDLDCAQIDCGALLEGHLAAAFEALRPEKAKGAVRLLKAEGSPESIPNEVKRLWFLSLLEGVRVANPQLWEELVVFLLSLPRQESNYDNYRFVFLTLRVERPFLRELYWFLYKYKMWPFIVGFTVEALVKVLIERSTPYSAEFAPPWLDGRGADLIVCDQGCTQGEDRERGKRAIGIQVRTKESHELRSSKAKGEAKITRYPIAVVTLPGGLRIRTAVGGITAPLINQRDKESLLNQVKIGLGSTT